MGYSEAELEILRRNVSGGRQKGSRTHQAALGRINGTKPGASKHRSRKTVLDGLTFDSAKEAKRWQELTLLQQVGAIRDLRRQVWFALYAPNGERICSYVADAVYWDLATNQEVREDTKSGWTRRLPVYRIKAKWMAAQGRPITEV